MTDQPDNHWHVTHPEAGLRLDLFIASRSRLSRIQVKRLLERGQVRVNGRRAAAGNKGDMLAAGDMVEVEPITPVRQMTIVPEPENSLTLLASGEGWLVVDKPAGMPVHPLEPGETGTVLNAVAARRPEVRGVGEGGLRSGVVHRLDVETSGALLIATSQPCWEKFRAEFTAHRTRKIYRALVHGGLAGEGEEKVWLAVGRHKPAKVKVVKPRAAGGRLCDLKWRVVEAFADATLVEIQMGTGFLHQIRVTMAHLGHPVMGDAVYGRPDCSPRLMLHATELEAPGVKARSPLPWEFLEFVEREKEKHEDAKK